MDKHEIGDVAEDTGIQNAIYNGMTTKFSVSIHTDRRRIECALEHEEIVLMQEGMMLTAAGVSFTVKTCFYNPVERTAYVRVRSIRMTEADAQVLVNKLTDLGWRNLG